MKIIMTERALVHEDELDGMRIHFAGQALAGLCARRTLRLDSFDGLVAASYRIADAMVAAAPKGFHHDQEIRDLRARVDELEEQLVEARRDVQ